MSERLGMTSQLCTQEDLTSEAHRSWCQRMREPVTLHRKQWEFSFIAEALQRRDALAPNNRGVGFGCGEEPLAALFVSLGCEVLATDLDPSDPASAAWAATGQHGSLAKLNRRGIPDSARWEQNARFRPVDMNHLPADLGIFDFLWSSCALEHLGSIELGLAFIVNACRHLKPGGVAVHTTEFNLDSNTRTVEDGPTVLFRQQDIERLAWRLPRIGCRLSPVDYTRGTTPADRHVDAPPYALPHLKLAIGEFTATSIGLIVLKDSV